MKKRTDCHANAAALARNDSGRGDPSTSLRCAQDDKQKENTARQEALYRFLLGRGDKWTSMEQSTDSVKEYPAYFRGTYHNSYARRLLTSDIEQMNGSEKFEKIIVSGSRGIKLATETDFEKFLEAELREVFRKLKRVRTIARKGSHDQQIDLEGQIREAFLGGD